MMVDIDWNDIPTRGGVYCMNDLEESPVYVGEARNSNGLRGRLREHFVQQTSSVVAHGRLDLLDIFTIDLWTPDDASYDAVEKQLIHDLAPPLNRGSGDPAHNLVSSDTPDKTVQVCTKAERDARLRPVTRIDHKLSHIRNMVNGDAISLPALSRGQRKRQIASQDALQYHFGVIEDELNELYSLEGEENINLFR